MWSTRLIKSQTNLAPSPPHWLTSPTRIPTTGTWRAPHGFLHPILLWSLLRAARRLSFWTGKNPTMKLEVRSSRRKWLKVLAGTKEPNIRPVLPKSVKRLASFSNKHNPVQNWPLILLGERNWFVWMQTLIDHFVNFFLPEYEVVSTSKGPNGEEVSVLTTNQTHTAVENLKPESRSVATKDIRCSTAMMKWWIVYSSMVVYGFISSQWCVWQWDPTDAVHSGCW